MAASYDRAAESLGNFLHMEHVNIMVPEQLPAIVFYISGLGYTRDPYLMVGLDNMWVNMGRSQMHLPRRDPSPQRLRGTVGMVSPDLDDVETSLGSVAERLAGTEFSFTRKNDCIEATCPWGNHIRVHAPGPEYGTMQIGMPYVELNAPVGSAEAIARFYREIMGANATVAHPMARPVPPWSPAKRNSYISSRPRMNSLTMTATMSRFTSQIL